MLCPKLSTVVGRIKMTVKILTQPQGTEFSQELMSLQWDSKPQMVLLPWKTS